MRADIYHGLLGPVAVPKGRVVEIGEDYVLSVREDELGVQYVERYRLMRERSDAP
jgi:hypothetical protein